jgi:cytochrome c biogenesis protein CcdA
LDKPRENVTYAVLVLVVVLIGIGGYGAYALYPRFNLPAVDSVGIAVLSLAAGIAAFFSPCSFPLLATLLIREMVRSGKPAARRSAWGRALAYPAALSLGALGFLALTGSVIAAGGQALVEGVTFTSLAGRIIRTLAGSLLILFGFAQLDRVRLPFSRVASVAYPLLQSQARIRRRAPVAGFAIFGFAYLIAGIG